MCETQEIINNSLGCLCKVSRECILGKSCECIDYCKMNLPLYHKINDGGKNKICWLTFSPKPQTEAMRQFGASDHDRFKDFHKSYFKKNKYVKDYILDSELNKKGLLHFHVLFSHTSKVSIIKTVVQPLYFQGNVEAIWDSLPKHGIHYLFKETKSMIEYFDDECSYFMSVYAYPDGTSISGNIVV